MPTASTASRAKPRVGWLTLGTTLVGVLDETIGIPIGDTDGVCDGGSDALIVPGSEFVCLLSLLGVGIGDELEAVTELGAWELVSTWFCVADVGVGAVGTALTCELGETLRLDGELLF